jgi:hypothetical protein
MSVHYALDRDAIARRALGSAIAETVSAVAPPLFVMVVLARLNVAPTKFFVLGGALLALLGAARAFTTWQRLKVHLARFAVDVEDDDVVITTLRGEHKVPHPSVERVREIPGLLGGLRIELAPGWDGKDDSPEIVDVPRGGEGFAELRAALGEIRALEAPRRVQRYLRVGLIVCVTLGVFFVPFFLDLLGSQSRIVALAVVLALWVAMRVLYRPR